MSNKKDAKGFIKRLKDDKDFRVELIPTFKQIKEGDWKAIIRMAKGAGYSFTEKGLKAALPESFYKGHGKNPEMGWEKKPLKSLKKA